MSVRALVVVAEPVPGDQLEEALAGAELAEAELRIVAPSLSDSVLAFWVSDADEAIAAARRAAVETTAEAEARGARTSTEAGESDPLVAIEDALRTFPADQIVVFRHREGEEAYREDTLDPQALEDRFGLPVAARRIDRA